MKRPMFDSLSGMIHFFASKFPIGLLKSLFKAAEGNYKNNNRDFMRYDLT